MTDSSREEGRSSRREREREREFEKRKGLRAQERDRFVCVCVCVLLLSGDANWGCIKKKKGKRNKVGSVRMEDVSLVTCWIFFTQSITLEVSADRSQALDLEKKRKK